jgi:tRNA modification GTPase
MAETIFALATPPGRSGVAVYRISGPQSLAAAEALGAGALSDRRAALRRLSDPFDGAPLDDALALRFCGPRSFTGEDVIELHLHGGPAVCRAVGETLSRLPGLRQAEAGEFTRRALMNGKLDLSQVEGIGDLLAAETSAQARQAMALMDGALSRATAGWRESFVSALALIEASIDFAEEDVPETADAADAAMAEIEQELVRHVKGSDASERLREGFEVALVGPPNVGKSTLLNALAGRDVALTSEIAGTTRDLIEVRMEIGGLPVTVVDTAGLRESSDRIESLGIERTRRRAAAADLRVFLVEIATDVDATRVALKDGDEVAIAKGDLWPDPYGVSGITGTGIPELLERIRATLSDRLPPSGLLARERTRAGVAAALQRVMTARSHLRLGAVELAAADLHSGIRSLDSVVGRVDVEDVLDRVFRDFCIGK